MNKGERIVGSLLFKVGGGSVSADDQVNDARSYFITLDITIDRPGPSHNMDPLHRRATYDLSQQCFKWVTARLQRVDRADSSYSYNPDQAAAAGGMGY